jgi:DNA-binding CsgD family transcriptional regulator
MGISSVDHSSDLRVAYRLAAIADRAEVEAAAKTARGPSKVLLHAIGAQYKGDVERAVALLNRLITKLPLREKAYIADVLAPILVMRHDTHNVRILSHILGEAGWVACAQSFLTLVEAKESNTEAAVRGMNSARASLSSEDDDIVRLRVLQRMALSAFYMKRFDEAIDLAMASASLSTAHGAWRTASSCYSIAYNIHHDVTGNLSEADRFARLCKNVALKSKDLSFIHAYTVAEYEIAVQFSDEPRIKCLEAEMQQRPLPQQYTEHFALKYSQALMLGSTNLVAMRSLLRATVDMPSLSRGKRALSFAVMAISYASEIEDEQARNLIRTSLHELGRPHNNDPAYERGYRRMARALASVACSLIGDHVHGNRIVSTLEALDGHGEQFLPDLIYGRKSWTTADSAYRGVARMCTFALAERKTRMPPAGLTQAELEVLKLFACGYNAVKIAKETQRSVNTIYNHSRSILEKLDAARIGEALANARNRGIAL